MKPSAYAFKGYNFQGTVYCYLLCLMDLHRLILELDAEKPVENNFDDIYVKMKDSSFYIQVKNYPNVDFNKIKFEDRKIKIPGYESITVGTKKEYKKNIIIIKDLIIPEDKINCQVFGLDCFEGDNFYIAGYNELDINDFIRESYMDEKRYNDILKLADKKINNGEFKFKISELPKIYTFNQKLQDETVFIRNVILNDTPNILFVVGKPGVGKSHLINELENNKIITNYILERLWISENDVDKKERLKYNNFIADISKQIFNKSYIETEENIIKELNETNKTLVIDGLDHVENYNSDDLDKFFEFFEKFNDAKLMIFTRPLKKEIKYEIFELDNWTEKETLDYLEFMNITNYEDRLEINRISNGYPIIVSFLAKHYIKNNEIPEIGEIVSLNSFYDSLIKEGIMGMSIFLINNSYFKISELEELLSPVEFRVVNEIIERSPYLFSIKYDRVFLIHDSLNLYLREKNPDYLFLNKDVINKISEESLNGNLKYISRLDSFSLNENVKIETAKKYCNFEYINKLLEETLDYEVLINIVYDFGNIIYRNYKSFTLNEFYNYILISECVSRDHHDGFYLLIIERIKYYLKNDLLKIEDLYSTGLLYSSLSCDKEKSYEPLVSRYSVRFNDFSREISDFDVELKKSNNYFKIFEEKIDIEDYLNKKIKNIDISDKTTLVYLISYLYIHNLEYNGYEMVAKKIIDEKNPTEALKLFIPICRKYKIRDFMAKWGINEIRDFLFSLGIDNGDNYYKNNTLKEHIIEYSGYGSFSTNEYICKYLRLARYEGRKIDINSLGIYYYMYYNRKDYSLYKLPLALVIFFRKKYIELKDCVDYIYEAMEMSEKGIRTIMTDFYNLLNDEEFGSAQEHWNDRIIISDLNVDKINIIDEDKLIQYLGKEMEYHSATMNIKSEYLGNMLRSKYCKNVIATLDYWGFKIDDIPASEFDINLLKNDKHEYKSFEERDWLLETDLENIKNNNISCVDLAKFTDGWHNTLPYVELFEAYSKEEIQNNVIEIIRNVCFAYKKFNMYANRNELLGNYLLFLDLYIIDNVNWDELFESFIKFLELSLIKK